MTPRWWTRWCGSSTPESLAPWSLSPKRSPGGRLMEEVEPVSKEVEWGQIFGEGDVVCTCDNCGHDLRFPFEDSNPDFRGVQTRLFEMGWTAIKVGGAWRDFCCRILPQPVHQEKHIGGIVMCNKNDLPLSLKSDTLQCPVLRLRPGAPRHPPGDG